jgi:hypothetical protein
MSLLGIKPTLRGVACLIIVGLILTIVTQILVVVILSRRSLAAKDLALVREEILRRLPAC